MIIKLPTSIVKLRDIDNIIIIITKYFFPKLTGRQAIIEYLSSAYQPLIYIFEIYSADRHDLITILLKNKYSVIILKRTVEPPGYHDLDQIESSH